MDQEGLAAGKKNASLLNASLVFIDETGLLMAPLVRRTWSPRGQTPVLHQRTRLHEKVSAIAALTISPKRKRIGLYFALGIDVNVNTTSVVAFLRALCRHIRNPLIVIWDRLPAHCAREVADYAAAAERVMIELLPPYAPELNPVEYLWAYLKLNPLANFAPADAPHLCEEVREHFQTVRDDQALLKSLVRSAPLSF